MIELMKKIGFIEVSDLVPQSWGDWFWCLISEDAPFSWGDNNRTLIAASRFHAHCIDRLEDVEDVSNEEIEKFLKTIESLGETYIDLEN